MGQGGLGLADPPSGVQSGVGEGWVLPRTACCPNLLSQFLSPTAVSWDHQATSPTQKQAEEVREAWVDEVISVRALWQQIERNPQQVSAVPGPAGCLASVPSGTLLVVPLDSVPSCSPSLGSSFSRPAGFLCELSVPSQPPPRLGLPDTCSGEAGEAQPHGYCHLSLWEPPKRPCLLPVPLGTAGTMAAVSPESAPEPGGKQSTLNSLFLELVW